jgi:hypothetical protein
MEESFDKLKKWLGIKDSLKLFNRKQRGIYSTNPIEKNKIIIKVKSKFLIEYQQIYKLYPIDGIEEANSLVAFFLTKLFFDSDENWMNYLNTFPNDISEFPICWNKSEINNLTLTSAMVDGFTNVNSHLESITNDFEIIKEYNEVNKIIENINDDLFFSTYLKYRILVGSRIFGYIKYGNQTSGMIPYIDMINHSTESNTTWYFDDNSDSFVLVSTCAIPKNHEIVDDYGVSNNVDFLLFYGFTLESSSNPNPILRLNLEEKIYDFSLQSSLDMIEPKENIESIKKKLSNIYNHHIYKLNTNKSNTNKSKTNKSNKNQTINEDIINIYNDEIKVIKHLLKL